MSITKFIWVLKHLNQELVFYECSSHQLHDPNKVIDCSSDYDSDHDHTFGENVFSTDVQLVLCIIYRVS